MRRRRPGDHRKASKSRPITWRSSGGSPRVRRFATAAAAVGCSTKSIQRFMARTGGLMRRARERSSLRLSAG